MPPNVPRVAEVRARLARYSLDQPDADFQFSQRLARENRWSARFTTRCVEEYKRFALLAVCAHHPVTPSDAVDQVWHLHLTYTTSYWLEFCPHVLGVPLHHGPTRGGSQERRKFFAWYEETLISYRRVFGHEPPRDIWPTPEERFSERADGFARINLSESWVIPRPRALKCWWRCSHQLRRLLR